MSDTRSLEQWAADANAADCAAQGLPRYIKDPVALAPTAAILLASATTVASHGSAAVVEATAIGAARTHHGEQARGRPTRERSRAVGAARLQNNAG